MTQRRLLTLTLVLVSSVSLMSGAQAQEQLRNEIEIDRSVLEDLKGYEPPAMFGATAKSKPVAAPLTRAPVKLPDTAPLTVPKADALLDFPVKNDNVVTRQRMTAPDEAVAHANPDYSDSHTLLKMTPKEAKLAEAASKPKPAAKKIAKAPLPPKKPSIQLASTTTAEVKNIEAVKVKDTPAKAAPVTPEKVTIKATQVPPAVIHAKQEPVKSAAADLPAPVMIPATPQPKYVPKTKPTMPAVPSGDVEKAKLDAFALPLNDKDPATDIVASKPTPGERMMDQALTSKMAQVDKKDIESVVAGGDVAPGRKDEPLIMASLPEGKTGSARIETITMEFKPKFTELQSDQQSILKGDILSYLKKNEDARLQILSFASEGSGTNSDARRLSLSRALSVRAYLLDKGIAPSRMDVRAMGNNTTEEPLDRVDLVFLR